MGETLIVGANMYLGRLARHHLAARGGRWRALDDEPVVPLRNGETTFCGDLCDTAVIAKAARGCDAVIDFSKLDLRRCCVDPASIGQSVSNFWEAVTASAIKRVVTFNSDGIVGFYRRSAVLDHLSVPRPDGPTGIAGAFNESLAALHAYKHGIRALCVRMGACRPEPVDERMLSTWISPGDFQRLIAASLIADYSFEIIYGVSANSDRWWDNANAYRLGYRPLDKSDRFAPRLRGRRSADAIENSFQGGKTAAANFSGDPRRIP